MDISLFGFDNSYKYINASLDTAEFTDGTEGTIKIGDRDDSDYTGRVLDTQIGSGGESGDNFGDAGNVRIKTTD